MAKPFLTKRYRPDEIPGVKPTSRQDYELSCPIDEDWSDCEQRVMIVLETIDGQDLKARRLLDERSKKVLHNLFTYAIKQARMEFGFNPKKCEFATVNLNNYKYFDQPKETWNGHRRIMARRVRTVIESTQPTHVLVMGDWAMKALLTTEEFLEKKRGWTFDFKAGEWECKICGSLDLQPLYSTRKEDEDADEKEEEGDVFGKANLLYYASRNIVNALAGRNLYDLSYIKPNVQYVDTLKKFKKLYSKLIESEIVAVDTETANGSVNHNAIHTIQFSMEPTKSYFLPIDHPETPFDKKEVRYIKKKLREFFYAKPKELPLKYLIMQYGTFDLRVLRVELGMPIIFHPVWEIQAGEWCFHPETLVKTEYGLKSVRDIVEKYPDIRVWSFNFENSRHELKSVVNRMYRPTQEDLIEIAHEHGTLRVTADHKIWSNTRKAYVKAAEIEEGEDLELFLDGVMSAPAG
jgi:hypothetical protein